MATSRSEVIHVTYFFPLIFLLLLAGTACGKEDVSPEDASPERDKTVQAAISDSGLDKFQTEIYLLALRELGYETKPSVTLTLPEHYELLASGKVDFWTDGRFCLKGSLRGCTDDHENYLSNVNEDRQGAQRVGYLAERGALQGYLIDKKSADEHNITNISDFKNPEIASLFDSNGDGKADMVGCPQNGPVTTCQQAIDHHMDAYELGGSINVMHGSYNASMQDIVTRYQQGKPVFFYTWTPNWTVAKLRPGKDVIWLEVPPETLPGPGCAASSIQARKRHWMNDPCLMGFPANDIRPVANMQFMRGNNNVRRLFQILTIPEQDISDQQAKMLDGENSDEDISRHAKEWVQANQAEFDKLIQDALEAGVPSKKTDSHQQ